MKTLAVRWSEPVWCITPARAACVGVCALLLAACHRTPPNGEKIAATLTFGEPGLSPGQFSYPRAMTNDGTYLWVVDKAARVQRMDPATGESPLGWRMPEWKLGKPTGISVWKPVGGADTDELVFLPDTHYHRVMVYRVGEHPAPDLGPANDGTQWGGKVTLVARFGEYGSGPGQFTYPTDVAILPTPDGKSIARLYVSEYGGTDRVSVFEPDGPNWKFSFAFGRFGSGDQADPVEFSRPQSVEIDTAKRELVIADACNHRVGRFTLEGRLIAWIGGPEQMGSGPGQFTYPYGLALLGDGSALVAEFGNNRVQRIDLASGTSMGTYGQAGREAGQLATPWAVTALADSAFVLDSGNNRVMRFPKPTSRVAGAQPTGAHR
ncbi:MAG: hypothetical protein JSR77_17530 [Planctomycetes bacterium]|nr:hypothetical protein [Planctomycetota bacterium]